MAGYTKVNLKDEVEDQAPNFGLEGKLEMRMARVPLELESNGVSYQRIAPNFRAPVRAPAQDAGGGLHRAQRQRSAPSSTTRSSSWSRSTRCGSHKDTMRSFEGGPDGAELLAVGAPNTGPGDAETENDWWSD